MRRGVTIAGGIVVLALMLTFFLVLCVVLLCVGLILGGFVWWKTREIRRQLKAAGGQWQPREATPMRIVEGEVIRELHPDKPG
ncbi:MAG: hypothetical protein EXR86_07030 [Gammaproteobacteria bacterium]|nr:hypothetical protein [Gammaproteobacteria bacterium]